MDMLIALFGSGRDLDTLQMAARAAATFAGALVLIRISGRRSFGQRSPAGDWSFSQTISFRGGAQR